MVALVTVIVSGLPAVGKTTVAQALARRFGLKYHSGGDVLKEMAIERGYQPAGEGWWDTPEGIRFLEERRQKGSFDRDVDARLSQVAEKGGVIITSYPLPWLVTGGIKIWLKASPEKRAARMVNRDHISYNEAVQVVAKRDSENKKLYFDLYGIRFGEDLSVFDFVLNTEELTSREVISILAVIIKCLL